MGISRKAMVAATWATSLVVVAGGGVAWSNVHQAAPTSDRVDICVRISNQTMRLETEAKPCKLTAPTFTREERISLAPADAVDALASRLDTAEGKITQQGQRLNDLQAVNTSQSNALADMQLYSDQHVATFSVEKSELYQSGLFRVALRGSGLKPNAPLTATDSTGHVYTHFYPVGPDGVVPNTAWLYLLCGGGRLTFRTTAYFGNPVTAAVNPPC